ncbi:pre-rRNA-processing protein esf1, partial [Ascosphaera pollenicola]
LKRDDTKKQLQRFYRLDEDHDEDETDESDGEEKDKKKKKKKKKEKKLKQKKQTTEETESEQDQEESSGDDDDLVQRELAKANKRSRDPSYDPARGGGFSESSSSESSSDEDSEDEEEEDQVEELEYQQRTGVPMGDVTNRIAVVNLDWDNIRTEDLIVALSSFAPAGKGIEKVTVYPSEFGKERMEREAIEGPPRELFADKHGKDDGDSDSDSSNSDDDDEKIKEQLLQEDEGKEFDDARLRKYQLERLRYYYAVLTCSSKEVAKHIYDAVDGTEYEATANFFDLRFIPDDTSFDDDVPRDECERIPDGYRPTEFVTDALQHSKVKLTWDADDTARKEAQARAFRGGRKEIDENDLKAYLGSDSSSDGEEDDAEEGGAVEVVDEATGERKKISKKEEARRRMRALLGLSEKPSKKEKDAKPVGEMEVTFSAGLSSNPKHGSVFENEPEKEETTMERYIRKERERKARRKAKLKAARHGETVAEDSDQESGADADADAVTAPEEAEDLGFDDPFFTAPEHDAKAAAAKRKEEKRKKREEREADERAAAAKRAELELLMMDDEAVTGGKVAADGGAHIKHFDMKEIERAEKQAAKKGKKKSKYNKAREADTSLVPDDFSVNVADPRFAGLFESHEFAIDPSNPKFKGTEGMKKFLEEGRKRRRGDADGDNADVKKSDNGKKKRKTDDLGIQGDTEDLDRLVQRVKSKTKKSN